MLMKRVSQLQILLAPSSWLVLKRIACNQSKMSEKSIHHN